MAKNKPADLVEEPTPPVSDPPMVEEQQSEPPRYQTVDVLLRRDLQCGPLELKVGDKIAEVALLPGVHLNFLACAIENAMAGPIETK